MTILNKILNYKNNKIRKPTGYSNPEFVNEIILNYDYIVDEWNAYKLLNETRGEQIDKLSKSQSQLNLDKKWTAIIIYGYSCFNNKESINFPTLAKIIKKYPEEIKLALFSSMAPGKRIPPHRGRNHGVIRTQIGLDIPEPLKTGLRVENITVVLKEKEVFLFDDTFEHEAWNESDSYRTVIIIDSVKKFPFFYALINNYLLKKMKKKDYIMDTLKKFKN
jgi:aspartyl/asparaginyl beta-hydroxylase (cupin superfamily)